jgi:hypothetical protein
MTCPEMLTEEETLPSFPCLHGMGNVIPVPPPQFQFLFFVFL